MNNLFKSKEEENETLKGIRMYLDLIYRPILKDIHYNLPNNEKYMSKSEILNKLQNFKESKKDTIYCTVSCIIHETGKYYRYDYCWFQLQGIDEEIKFIKKYYEEDGYVKGTKQVRLVTCFEVDQKTKKIMNVNINEVRRYLNKKYGEEKVNKYFKYFKNLKEDN